MIEVCERLARRIHPTHIESGFAIRMQASVVKKAFSGGAREAQSSLKEIVAARLETLGIDQFEAARRAGLERAYVWDLLSGRKKTIRGDNLRRLADALELDAGALIMGDAVERSTVVTPIIGRVGAELGCAVHQVDSPRQDTALPPPGSPTSVAVEVVGPYLRPFADIGTLLYFDTGRSAPSRDMVRNVMLLELENENRLVIGRLLRGSRDDSFDVDLIGAPPLEDCSIRRFHQWLAAVPASHALNLITRRG